MDPLQYLETLKPMIEKSLATQVALRTEAVAATELPMDGTKQSFVDAGALMSFTERLTRQHREDVLNGTLLAQRAADAVADRTKQEEAWYRKYVEVLSHIGWVIQSFNFQRYTMQGKSFFINKALLDIVKDLLSKDELGHIEHTIESLGNDDNQPWWHVFSKESSGPSENGNFQVCPCHQDESGQVIMVLGAFYFQGSETNHRWLWFHHNSSKMHFFSSTQICTLDEDVYAQVRHKIKEVLGKESNDYIGALHL